MRNISSHTNRDSYSCLCVGKTMKGITMPSTASLTRPGKQLLEKIVPLRIQEVKINDKDTILTMHLIHFHLKDQELILSQLLNLKEEKNNIATNFYKNIRN